MLWICLRQVENCPKIQGKYFRQIFVKNVELIDKNMNDVTEKVEIFPSSPIHGANICQIFAFQESFMVMIKWIKSDPFCPVSSYENIKQIKAVNKAQMVHYGLNKTYQPFIAKQKDIVPFISKSIPIKFIESFCFTFHNLSIQHKTWLFIGACRLI